MAGGGRPPSKARKSSSWKPRVKGPHGKERTSDSSKKRKTLGKLAAKKAASASESLNSPYNKPGGKGGRRRGKY